MTAADPPVVVCVYPGRGPAGELVAILREHGLSAVVVPSDRHPGEWDVLVPARDAVRAIEMVRNLLAPD